MAAAFAIGLATPAAVEASFLQAGVDAARTGHSDQAAPEWSDVAWRIQLPLRAVALAEAPPIVIGDDVYLLAGEYRRGSASPIDDPNLHTALDYWTVQLYLFRIPLGTGLPQLLVEWMPEPSHDPKLEGSASLVSDGHALYVVHFDAVEGFDLDGKRLWRTALPSGTFTARQLMRCVEPAVRPGMLYIACSEEGSAIEVDGVNSYDEADWDTFIVAVHTSDGALGWTTFVDVAHKFLEDDRSVIEYNLGQLLWFSVIGDQAYLLAQCAASRHPYLEFCLMAYRLADGQYRWTYASRDLTDDDAPSYGLGVAGQVIANRTGPVTMYPAPVTGNATTLFLRLADLTLVDAATGDLIRRIPVRAVPYEPDWTGPGMAYNDESLFVSVNNRLAPFDTKSWKAPWIFTLINGEKWAGGSLLVTDGIIVARSEAGRLSASDDVDRNAFHFIDASTGAQLLSIDFYPQVKTQSYEPFKFALSGGRLVVAGTDGSLTVIGMTAASIQPVFNEFNLSPAVGERVIMNMSGTRAGVFGAPTSFRADWGDGEATPWQSSPEFEHRYPDARDYKARFEARNAAGQSASQAFVFRVGAQDDAEPATEAVAEQRPPAPNLNWAQRLLVTENLPLMGGLGSLAFILLVGALLVRPGASSVKTPRYVVERELGRGTFGTAFLATDNLLDRKVVLKQPRLSWILTRADRDRFLREARVLARLHHPNIVSIYEVLADQDPPMLVLEYVEAGSLAHALSRTGKFPLDEAIRLCLDVLAGLDHIHGARVIHRDLKPENILLDAHGTAKVTDFGVARDPTQTAHVTMQGDGSLVGSPGFMSPEQAEGASVDARTDLFAVGAILYNLLTGQHPFAPEDASPKRVRALRAVLPHRDVPAGLDLVLQRALARDPQKRFQSAKDMSTALRDCLLEIGEARHVQVADLRGRPSGGGGPRRDPRTG